MRRTESPISDFINRMSSFHVHDTALLIWLVALQETGWPISPYAAVGRWGVGRMNGMTEEEYEAAFARLIESGEVERVEEEDWRGFQVVRFDELQDGMMDFGKRRYFRLAQKRRRSEPEQVPA